MSHSMALLADGWHISTHVLAFLITAVAYYFARTQAGNARFSFGTGKIGVLGGFTSAAVLSIVALLRSEEHTSELQSRFDLVCRLLLEKKNVRQASHSPLHC